MPRSRPVVIITLILCFSLALCIPAHAWDAKGHQIVALIADRHLTDQARQRLKQLLPKNETLVQASTWPDKIKKAIPQANPLHYVDVPRGSNYYDPDRDCPQRNCLVEAINWYLQVLKAKESPLAEKQIALNYLVHLVGDLHQPLHVGFLDDLGGTKTKVTFQGKEQTLHELWDSGILATEKGSARQMAERLDEEISDSERKAWQAGTPKEWADESIALNTKYVYPLPESREISEEYAKRALPVLHKRLVQAGVRLAWLLNKALTTQSRRQ